ncbi:LptE family protein [Ancylomarina sp. YFZ004]
MNWIKSSLLIIIIGLAFTACKVSYSFTGGTLSIGVKTFSVQFFQNRAPLVNPNLSDKFTEDLKEKFRSRTSLNEIVDGEGHLNFSGEITGYQTRAMDITSNDIASTNRLTITIRVKFTNEIDPDNDFDKSFSAFEDFDSNSQLSDVENDLVEKILDDIYNQSVVNW